MAVQREVEELASPSPPKDHRASYPPATASMAFPDDPFSEPERKSPAQLVQSGQSESLSDWAKNTRFTVLNHFSQVTNVARNGAHSLLSSPLFQPPPTQQSLHNNNAFAGTAPSSRTSGASSGTSLLHHGPVGPFGPNNPEWRQTDVAQKSGTGDFDSAHVYLARWAKIVAEEGEANRRREAEARRATLKAAIDVEESEVGNFEVWTRLPHIDRPEATRSRENAISRAAWRSLFDDTGRPHISFTEMKALVFQQGFGKGKERMTGTHWDQLDPRAECWSFLLGAQRWNATIGRQERREQWCEKVEQYWHIKTQNLSRIDYSASAHDVQSSPASISGTTAKDNAFWRDQRHRVHVDCLRVDRKLPIFRDCTDAECLIGGGSENGDADVQQHINAHLQRLEEILLSYVAYDRVSETEQGLTSSPGSIGSSQKPILGGYVQGMSDLCAPLYVVCHGDEAKTFWLFVGLMKRLRGNFYADQSGMKAQLSFLQRSIGIMDASLHAHLDSLDGLNLFFCFRWLLVCFKREFDFPDILMLWEAIWAAELSIGETRSSVDRSTGASPTDKTKLSDQFQIFIALAILEQQRDVVIKYLHHFDEILQYMNGLSGQIDVDTTIGEAQVLCLSLRQVILQQDAQQQPQHAGKGDSSSDADTSLPTFSYIPIDNSLRALTGLPPKAIHHRHCHNDSQS